jgi:hypothetical protein
MLPRMGERKRAAVSGAAAAVVWAAIEPLDRRVFRCDYSDVALLGKAFTRSRAWPAVGLAVHAANGAAFGLVFSEVRRVTHAPTRRLAFAMALAEHVTLWPLGALSDRFHPARGEPGVPRLIGSRRAYAQATVRHALFGIMLGRLAG